MRWLPFLTVVMVAIAGCDRATPPRASNDERGTFAGWDRADSGRPLMRLARSGGQEESRLHVPESAEVVIDGQPATLAQLREGMQVSLTVRDKTIIKVEAQSSPAAVGEPDAVGEPRRP